MGREAEIGDRRRERKHGKINCSFIMFSSDLTLAVVTARPKALLDKSHAIHKLKVNVRSVSHAGPFIAPLAAVAWRWVSALLAPNEMFLLKLITCGRDYKYFCFCEVPRSLTIAATALKRKDLPKSRMTNDLHLYSTICTHAYPFYSSLILFFINK